MKLLDPSTVADLLSMKRSAVIALARGNAAAIEEAIG